jgi:acyl transferase domain-containing protein
MAGNAANLSPEKQTLLALRALRQRVDELEGRARSPIAIVGMACRFPGGADTAEAYWDLLAQGRDAVSEIPRQRIDLDEAFDSRPQTPGKTYSRWAGLLEAPGDFDAEFFGISPREAVVMDPQQRLLLEVSWQALENAGINPKTLAGQNAGVFVGITTSEYAQLLQKTIPREQLAAYVLQGSALNATAGRLSYFYGLNGPSMAIDTACSSSLVAIDRACRSLRDGEIRLAIAAGVNVLATPETLIIASQWGMLSPSGKVRAFDSGGDGFVRGEGCGVVVLKLLGEAERSGDRILGVILGSAVNQDGASSGLTVPNGLAQQALLREAHRRAGIEAWQVGYVEAHGTGTSLGDPIEAEALGAVFAGRKQKLLIGSVKTNVGHLESAAGVAGLIKVVLGLQHGVVPGQLHWEGPSEHVRWSDLPLEVVTQARPWDPIEGRRIGGVSSFGFSGTNAHVIVEGWQEGQQEETGPEEEVLVVTARSEAALRALAERYAEFLAKSEAGWSDICYTAAMGRAVFGERLAVVAMGKAEAAEQLQGWLRGESRGGVYRGEVSAGQRAVGEALSSEASAQTVAAQFVRGTTIDWASRWTDRKPRRVELPTYAFQRERYWIDPVARSERESGERTGRGLLGRRLRAAGVRGQYESLLSAKSWIGEHVVEGRVVLPATGHLELMLEAAAEVSCAGCMLEDVVLQSPLVIDGERRVQTVVEAGSEGRSRVRVYAEQAGGEWERVSEGWLRVGATEAQKPERIDVEAIQARLQAREPGASFYAEMSARGLEFGACFRGVKQVWTGEGEALGEIAVTESAASGFELQPWWLDACLQVAGLAGSGEDESLYLPMSLDRLQVYAPPGQGSEMNPERSWSHVTTRRIDPDTLAAEVTITHPNGYPRLRIHNLRFRKVRRETTRTAIYGVDWIEAALKSAPDAITGHWLVLSGDNHLGLEVCNELKASGASCSLIFDAKPENVTQADTYSLRSEKVDDIREALRNQVESTGPLKGIVDLRSVEGTNLARLEDGGPEQLLNVASLDASLTLLQALLREQICPVRGVWLITRNAHVTTNSVSAEGRAIHALSRTAALEFPDLAIKSIDLDAKTDGKSIVRAIAGIDGEEMKFCGDLVFVPRLRERHATVTVANRELVPAESGLIEDLRLISAARKEPQEDEVEIEVHAHGVNFRDVMNSLGMLPGMSSVLGGECAGVVAKAGSLSGFIAGARVFAFARGSFKKYVTVKSRNVARVPQSVSLAQAAGLPVAYLTAIYGLDRLAHLQQGERVLIHSAAGGLGLAAIQVAKARGADIYATAGSEEKRAHLRTLGIQHVFSSRTVEFAEAVMHLTGGRGIDVVLNSLTGTLAELTLSIVARSGRFLEVGKRETLSSDVVKQLRPDVRHFTYDLGQEAAADPSLVSSLLQEILRSLAKGAMAPLPVTEFADPKEAFRYMAQARHIGKIIVTRMDAPRALELDPNATYLITGGCGGLGLIFAEAFESWGARHLVLMTRSAPGKAEAAIERIQARGVTVKVVRADVADDCAVKSVLQEIPSTRPLKGILHAAGVIEDHSLLEQSPASLHAVIRPKWHGAWNLHTLTHAAKLDFFVLFSSAAALLGSPGQANYAAANAMLDTLADYRRSLGLPAVSIQWGPWNAAGMTKRLNSARQSPGLGAIDPLDGIGAFETLVNGEEAVAAVLPVVSWAKYVSRRKPGTCTLLSHLMDAPFGEVTPGAQEDVPREIFQKVLQQAPAAERRKLLAEQLRQQALQILSLPPHTRIDEDEALHDLGLDSLMAVELRNALMATLDRQLSPTMVLDYPTLRTMTDFLLVEMFEVQEPSPAEARERDDLTALSEDEAEALLLEELGRREHGARR